MEHLLRREVITAVLVAVVFIEGAVLGQEFISFKNTDYLANVLSSVVTDLTNNARTEDHLALLTPDSVLTQAAQAKANDMAAKGYFSHVSPDGTLPWHWFDAVGYNYEYAGENLAVNFDDSQQLVSAWLASPAHRANILGSHFTSIGIGMATGTYEGKSTLFVVQFFAKPATTAAVAAAKPIVTTAPRAPAAAIKNVPATEPVVTEKATSVAPVVLGTETANPSAITSLMASPMSTSGYVFGALAILFLLALALGSIFHVHLRRLDALVGGLAVLTLLLAIAILNHGIFFSKLSLPSDTQSAAVYKAW